MENVIYEATIKHKPPCEGAPAAHTFVWLTKEANGYALWRDFEVDGESDTGPTLVEYYLHRSRNDMLEVAVRYVDEQRKEKV